MASSPADRRGAGERRRPAEQRSGDRRFTLVDADVERRSGGDRRQGGDRRSGRERRAQQTAGEHIRHALQLIARVAESDGINDELRRDLDAALFRLRFALDRLERGGKP